MEWAFVNLFEVVLVHRQSYINRHRRHFNTRMSKTTGGRSASGRKVFPLGLGETTFPCVAQSISNALRQG